MPRLATQAQGPLTLQPETAVRPVLLDTGRQATSEAFADDGRDDLVKLAFEIVDQLSRQLIFLEQLDAFGLEDGAASDRVRSSVKESHKDLGVLCTVGKEAGARIDGLHLVLLRQEQLHEWDHLAVFVSHMAPGKTVEEASGSRLEGDSLDAERLKDVLAVVRLEVHTRDDLDGHTGPIDVEAVVPLFARLRGVGGEETGSGRVEVGGGWQSFALEPVGKVLVEECAGLAGEDGEAVVDGGDLVGLGSVLEHLELSSFGEELVDAVVEVELTPLPKLQARDCDEKLGAAGDPEDGVFGHRILLVDLLDASMCPDDILAALVRDVGDGARHVVGAFTGGVGVKHLLRVLLQSCGSVRGRCHFGGFLAGLGEVGARLEEGNGGEAGLEQPRFYLYRMWCWGRGASNPCLASCDAARWARSVGGRQSDGAHCRPAAGQR
ncbi:hypothetical protein L1887_53556 [Cichorium endivia]|nr:hypothetical protein L1887_53556 [Cichorium endivia]